MAEEDKKIITHYMCLNKVVATMDEDMILEVTDPTLLLRTDFTMIIPGSGELNHGIYILKHVRDYLKNQYERLHCKINRPTFS